MQEQSTATHEQIIFQPEKYSPSAKTISAAGTLAEWQNNVLLKTHGQPWPLFAICCGFVGPLLKFAHMDSFGVHIHKVTSQGKTTMAQIAASVWGNGADPATDKNSFLCRWNSTANALVAVCAAHNDLLLCMDEFGTCPQKDAERFIYDIFGGKEKSRLTDKSNLREQRTWTVFIFSTGEISAAAKISQSGTARGGHFVRLLDIPGGELLIGDNPAALAKEFKKVAAQFYGTAGPAFLQAFITGHKGSAAEMENSIAALLASIEPRYHKMLPAGAAAAYGRVMDRFALIEAAGQLAGELLGWPDSILREIAPAIETVCTAWLGGNKMLTDASRGVDAVRAFILKHKDSRFAKTKDDRREIRDAVGYIVDSDNETCYAFETNLFKEACANITEVVVAQELFNRGHLIKSESDRWVHKITPPDGTKRRHFYTVKESLLADDCDDTVPLSRDGEMERDSRDGLG